MEKKTEDIILEELKAIRNEMATNLATKEELKAIRNEMTTNLATKEELKAIKNEMATKEDLIKINENLESLNRSVLLLQEEHGEQIKALHDARSLSLDTKKIQEERLSKIEKILDNHAIRINNLEITCVV